MSNSSDWEELRRRNQDLLRQKRRRSTSKSHRRGWCPDHGWLTSSELQTLEKSGKLYGKTEDERQRGYRLTQQVFNERRNHGQKITR